MQLTKTEIRKTARTLARAAGILEKYGWITGRLGDKSSGFCVSGAVLLASKYKPITGGFVEALHGYPYNYQWNDNECQSKEEAQEMLMTAASLAMSEAEVLP